MSFVPYQVDHSVKNVSKTLGFSKKKVMFKFGIANPRALSEGLSGPACRGSEHEVIFIWSLSSGKRQLLVDGKESHYSESGQNGWTSDRIWQHMFDIRVPAMGKFRALFISQPAQREIPGSRPFDLRLAGVSYFAFNQIYQLGTPTMITRGQPRSQSHGGGVDEPMSPEERRQLAQARLESLRDLREKEERERQQKLKQEEEKKHHRRKSSMNREEASLISFDDPMPPSQISAAGTTVGGMSAPGQPQPSNNYFASSITLDTAIAPAAANPYGQQSPYGQQQQPMYPGSYGAGPPQQPYGAAAPQPSPFMGAPQQQQPQPASNNGASTALTPYMPPAGQPAPSPYALPYNTTYNTNGGGYAAAPPQMGSQGSMYAPAPQQQQQGNPYGFTSSGSVGFASSGGSMGGNMSATGSPAPMMPTTPQTPSNYSYGSAPSFAQPPSQQQQPQPTQSSSMSNLYGYPQQYNNITGMNGSQAGGYGAPPPPQQNGQAPLYQQQSYGSPYQQGPPF